MSKANLLVIATSLLTSSLAVAGGGSGTPPSFDSCAIEGTPAPAFPSCTEGWHAKGFPESAKPAHLSKLPEDCYWDSGGFLQCFFATAEEACMGAITMNNEVEKNGTQWGFHDLTPPSSNDPDFRHCEVDVLDDKGNPTGTVQDVPLEYMDRPERGDFVQRVTIFGTAMLIEPMGPYKNQPDSPYLHQGKLISGKPYPGSEYGCLSKTMQNGTFDFRTIILGLNANRFGGHLVSDLAGYPYKLKSGTCIKNHPSMAGWCIESDDPLQTAPNFPNSAQVHHEIPRKFKVSGASCPWGRASMKNALVISAQLNNYFSNNYPEIGAVLRMNNTTPYPTFP